MVWRVCGAVMVAAACAVAAAADEQGPTITAERLGGRDRLVAHNPTPGRVTMTLELTGSNAASSRPGVQTFVLAAGERVAVGEVGQSDRAKPWKYEYKFRWQRGSKDARHDEAAVYRLPYLSGEKFAVMQGWGGTFSHTGPSQYAIDFAMPTGTPVCAARDGVVVDFRSGFGDGGPDRATYHDKANYIHIEHDDGTIAVYTHLTKSGVLVKLGQRVRAGDTIGVSGNSGFSSAPHLHFQVQLPVDGRLSRSIPVKFAVTPGAPDVPQKGLAYTAP